MSIYRTSQILDRDASRIPKLIAPHAVGVNAPSWSAHGTIRTLPSPHTDKVLDCFELAVLIVDERLHLGYVNQTAESLLARRDGLQSVGGRLAGSLANDTAQLGRLARRLLRRQSDSNANSFDKLVGVTLTRPSSLRPLELAAKALSEPTADGVGEVVLFVNDPDRGVQGNGGLLQSFYHLTRAESRLAVLIMNGHTLESSAQRLAVTKETVRKQIQSIFYKTGTHRQSELVRLLSCGIAGIR
jgi:DNA-binding CsgD family transcriptional regulator